MENRIWMQSWQPANHWQAIKNDNVLCNLCPRFCKIKPEKVGFCGVRKNVNGALTSVNYGKSVPITCESIETEAVFHYAPGEPILSLGNIGCMMKCDFCQNWATSQSRLVEDRNVAYISPESVVQYALDNNIRMLSWTYNDPVVWQEFVVDTARLAKQHGIQNLYKSAFYITPEAIDELLEVMDIFSISIKSLDDDFYRRVTKGRLEPVLEGVKQVYRAMQQGANVHLELSNLCVTGRNDNLEESLKTAHWMLEHLDANVPLHYVRFHPDYLYTQVERTDPAFLEQARIAAINAGLNYVYVGNVHGTPSSNTYCPACHTLVVERYGLAATSFLKDGVCPNCQHVIPIKMPWAEPSLLHAAHSLPEGLQNLVHHFRGVIRSCHVEQLAAKPLYFQFETESGAAVGAVQKMSCLRFMLSSPSPQATQVRLFYSDTTPHVYEVYDRAHFPVWEAEKTACHSEDVPPILGDQKIK